MVTEERLKHMKRGCFGKIKYYNEAMANEVLMKMKNKVTLNVYHCRFCKRYHIGHIKKPQQS